MVNGLSSEFKVQCSVFSVQCLTMRRCLIFWAFRYASGFPLYLCSPHFSPLSNSRSQISHSPFPNPISHHLAKDAAPIPNALAMSTELRAARSGKQNIVEGNSAATTSLETELKLLNVARASLQELLVDYEDYLRVNHLEQWKINSPQSYSSQKSM